MTLARGDAQGAGDVRPPFASAGAGPASAARPPFGSLAAATVIVVGLAAWAWMLSAQPGAGGRLALSVVFGAAFGIVLQRARFCFFCNFRDLIDSRDPGGMLAIVVAIATGVVGYTLVVGAWLPDPSAGRLPPEAFIGPVGPALLAAGLAFGAGMAISGSCVSAHLYRLGEGSPTAPFALAGTLAGFVAGFATWNPIYLSQVSAAPVLWLPAWLGYTGALVGALAVLGGIAAALARLYRRDAGPAPSGGLFQAVFVRRWPPAVGGVAVGLIATAAFLRVGPLGVTAEVGARARQAGDSLGLLPTRLEGLDTLRGCIAVVKDAALSPNGTFVIALVLAAFAAALPAGQFKPTRPSAAQAARGLGGGVLLGWGAMTGLGCTVGTLMSGIMAGAVSGWVFGAAVFAGVWATLVAGRRIGLLPR